MADNRIPSAGTPLSVFINESNGGNGTASKGTTNKKAQGRVRQKVVSVGGGKCKNQPRQPPQKFALYMTHACQEHSESDLKDGSVPSSAEGQVKPTVSPFDRPPNMSLREYRIFELSMFLKFRQTDNRWWDLFAKLFFTYNARVTVETTLYDGHQQRYTIGRTLIGKFFRTWFAGEGIKDLLFQLTKSRQIAHKSSIMLECDRCRIHTQYIRDGGRLEILITEGVGLKVEYPLGNDSQMKSWHMLFAGYSEIIPTTLIGTNPKENKGVPNATLIFLEKFAFKEKFQLSNRPAETDSSKCSS